MVSLVFAFIMSVLSLKYKPKPLLMVGVSLFIIAALGCSFAPTYSVMLFFYAITGIGTAMITPMSQALVGEHIDVDERPQAISYMLMSFTLVSAFISGPVMNWLAVWGGWRLSFLAYVFPGALIGLLAAYYGIPTSKKEIKKIDENHSYIKVFKEILTDKSAMACIICAAFGAASFTAVGTYGISSFIQRFEMTSKWRAPMWSVMTFTGAMGSYLSGRLVARFGRRPVSIIGVLMMGVFTISFMNVNDFWISAVLIIINGIGMTIWYPASVSLTMEQFPELRGSMMSLNNATRSFGRALGIGLGGLILLKFGYGYLGLVLGGLALIAAVLYLLFAVDPTRKQKILE
jgi:DHA1 family bicyclomycin/chloramphenicol resistance-like MFS transporter